MFDLIQFKEYRLLSSDDKARALVLDLAHESKPTHCPYCEGSNLHSKGRYTREVRHLRCFARDSYLRIHTHRYCCMDCSKSFIPELPGVLKGRHSSEPFRAEIYKLHEHGICGSTLAKEHRISAPTVERIYQQNTLRKAKERLSKTCPTVLGIDEHTLHKNGTYVTTFCDLKRHRVFDVAQGRSAAQLASFLLGLRGRKQVKVVCIDLCNPYRALIGQFFPNAKIVSDRFHVIRLVMYHFFELAKQLEPQIKYKRGLFRILSKRPDRLTDANQKRLLELFALYPVLKPLYEQMRKFCELLNLKSQNKRDCKKHIQTLLEYIEELKSTPFASMLTLANTLTQWAQPIVCMWRFSKNNSITEGFHRKMKLIQRRAYGFRNFNNYRLRVIAQCG